MVEIQDSHQPEKLLIRKGTDQSVQGRAADLGLKEDR